MINVVFIMKGQKPDCVHNNFTVDTTGTISHTCIWIYVLYLKCLGQYIKAKNDFFLIIFIVKKFKLVKSTI